MFGGADPPRHPDESVVIDLSHTPHEEKLDYLRTPARTLREFVAITEQEKASTLDGHLRRHDFSHWISGVFGDYPLANMMQSIERDYRAGKLTDVIARVSAAVRSRYEFTEPYPKCGS